MDLARSEPTEPWIWICMCVQEGTKALNALEREQNNYWLSGEGAGLSVGLDLVIYQNGALMTLPPFHFLPDNSGFGSGPTPRRHAGLVSSGLPSPPPLIPVGRVLPEATGLPLVGYNAGLVQRGLTPGRSAAR